MQLIVFPITNTEKESGLLEHLFQNNLVEAGTTQQQKCQNSAVTESPSTSKMSRIGFKLKGLRKGVQAPHLGMWSS